jgi:mono/diheme cytochrome c family protein
VIPGGILLSAGPAAGGGGLGVGLVVGIQLALVACLLGGFAWYVRERRPGWASVARIGAALSGLAGGVLLLAAILQPGASAGPLVNPVPDTVASVDRGAVLYQADCARCHGVDGLGGGVDAGTTELPPANLRSGHLNQHSDADIFSWISNGIPGGMPAWADKLSETDRWHLVNYLRSINGRGPSPAPSAAGPSALAGIGVAGVLGTTLLGWLGLGLRRARPPARRRTAAPPGRDPRP